MSSRLGSWLKPKIRHVLARLLSAGSPAAAGPATRDFQLGVLFVCLGNVCRSPMAQGVVENRIRDRGLHGRVLIGSAGTRGGDNKHRPPDWRAQIVMLRHDINIGHIRARQLVADDFEQFHLIIALDPPSAQQARALAQVESGRRRVQLLSDLTGSPDIPDPIEGSLRVFEEVFATLDGASDRLVGEIEKRLTRPECQDWPL